MKEREVVKDLLGEIEEVGVLIWQQKIDRYQRVKDITKKLGIVLPNFIGYVQQYQIEDISVDGIMEQLRCLVNGLERKDEVLLADTLNYEIYNTLMLYDELLGIMEEEIR